MHPKTTQTSRLIQICLRTRQTKTTKIKKMQGFRAKGNLCHMRFRLAPIKELCHNHIRGQFQLRVSLTRILRTNKNSASRIVVLSRARQSSPTPKVILCGIGRQKMERRIRAHPAVNNQNKLHKSVLQTKIQAYRDPIWTPRVLKM